MASIDTLVNQIADATLREKLAREVGEMKKRLSWGLVFERHLPENTRLLTAPIKIGTAVWERRSKAPRRFRVRAIEGDELVVVPEEPNTTAGAEAEAERIARADVLVEHNFAQAIYPTLTPIGAVRNGESGRPSHAVVQGENYHALQALLAAYERQFDVIYLDPPYNTGDRDWSYNNDYVDPNDTYRPSKWLAFMERRLRIARRLLKPDGVIVVTIDENEVHHLGMLLEQLFPEARQQMVTIVITPMGNDQGGFSRADEYAFFCFFGAAPKPLSVGDDFLSIERTKDTQIGRPVPWLQMIRSGGSSGARGARGGASMFYPILIDQKKRRAVGAGASMLEGDPDLTAPIDGYAAAWPVRRDGTFGQWRIGQTKLRRLIEKGFVRVGGYDAARETWALAYLGDNIDRAIASGDAVVVGHDAGVADVRWQSMPRGPVKTVWNRTRHSAGHHGSSVVSAFIGQRGAFSFPKSLYAVRDTLDILTYKNPDARILDFFAGSGTTLHATMLLNAEDGGSRTCILVTNNELKAETASKLVKQGHFRGDPQFEAQGVFEAACRPRVSAATTGVRPDGNPVEGTYLDGREYADGFEENIEFFRLDYLDAAEVEFGLRFDDLHPLLWLKAGGIGARESLDPSQPLGIPSQSPYAVLFQPSGMPALIEALPGRPDISNVFIVADSAEAFAQLSAELPDGIATTRLYRDYLETLRGATR